MKLEMKNGTYSEVHKLIKHPAKVVIATVQDKHGKFNSITLEWFMKTSIDPVMYAISIGHTRYSYECLQENRFFNICFPSKEMRDFTILSGSKSGRDLNKIETSEERWFKGRLKQYPIYQNAVVNLECKTITQVCSGDHTIFVGEVKYSWQNPERKLLLAEDL